MTDNHWLVDTEIKNSNIHGRGRFASVYIAKGTKVCVLNGKIIPKDGKHMPINGTHLCVECPQTFINHSTIANLELQGQIVFIASCNIEPGTELVLNYKLLTASELTFN
jgi:SET domain-containing protein